MVEPSLEMLAEIRLLPGRIPELDEQTRSVLAAIIMDETVDLPSSERGNLINYSGLSDDDFIKLFQPLVEVLQLDPAIDRPPLRGHIDRASKLGLVPSVSPIYDRMSLGKVHSGLGFRAKFRFTDWTHSDFVSAGQKLAQKVGGRPSRDVITAAGKGDYRNLGDFPTVDDIKSRFGRIGVFHELIGYPSCKGWILDDYLDWAFAFYRQNPNQDLTARIIDGFSSAGRGPSKQPIIKHFGSISKFKNLSKQEFDSTRQQELENRSRRLEEAEYLASRDGSLLEALTESRGDPDRILQITAQYRLATIFATSVNQRDRQFASQIKQPDAFVRWCMVHSEGRLSAANVETLAVALNVFDDLWPMYRFQNVDLTLRKAS